MFLALNSADFSNTYIRSRGWWGYVADPTLTSQPLLTVGSYLYFWGIFYVFVTYVGVSRLRSESIRVCICMIDERTMNQDHSDLTDDSPQETYRQIWSVIQKPSHPHPTPLHLTHTSTDMRKLLFALLFIQFGVFSIKVLGLCTSFVFFLSSGSV